MYIVCKSCTVMNRLKINIGGDAKLVSVYESYDEGKRYFAKLYLDFERSTEKNVSIDILITEKEYLALEKQLENRFVEEAYIHNDPTDKYPVLKVEGKLEVRLNPNFRAAKIHNLRNGLEYSAKEVLERKKREKGLL